MRKETYEYKTDTGKKDGVAKGAKAKEAKVNEKSKREAAAVARAKNKERIAKTGTLVNQKLYAPSKPNFHRRWVNDEGSRVASMENNGYTHAELSDSDLRLTSASNAGGRVQRLVGTKQDGSALHAYLMEIPTEFYNQDRQGNLDRISDGEKEMHRNGGMHNLDPEKWSGGVNFKLE